MSDTLYALFDAAGAPVTVEPSLRDAFAEAEKLPGHGEVFVDYESPGSEPNPLDDVGDGRGTIEDQPRRALARSGLPVLEAHEVMRLSLEDAWERMRPFYPETRMSQGKLVRVQKYDNPIGMKQAFLGRNYKTKKQPDGIDKRLTITPQAGIDVMGLSLLPYSLGSRPLAVAGIDTKLYGIRRSTTGENLTNCLWSTKECQNSCLAFSGHNESDVYNYVRKASATHALRADPVAFTRMLVEALRLHFHPMQATDDLLAARLNVYSDVPWELVAPWIFEDFSDYQFYDYTKVPGRMPPPNYDLTFSYSGAKANLEHIDYEVSRARRVATVFVLIESDKKGALRLVKPSYGPAGIPREFMGMPVVDGDVHDYRPLDPPNPLYPASCVVGLRYKAPKYARAKPGPDDLKAFVVPCHRVGDALVASVVPRQYGAEAYDSDSAA